MPSRPPGTRPASIWIWLLEGGEDGAEVQALGASYAAAAATYDAWLVRNWEDHMVEDVPATPAARAERFVTMRRLHAPLRDRAGHLVQPALPWAGAS